MVLDVSDTTTENIITAFPKASKLVVNCCKTRVCNTIIILYFCCYIYFSALYSSKQ